MSIFTGHEFCIIIKVEIHKESETLCISVQNVPWQFIVFFLLMSTENKRKLPVNCYLVQQELMPLQFEIL